jgi:hypothetical protein
MIQSETVKRVLAISGSPRKSGNTVLLLDAFLSGAKQNLSAIDVVDAHSIQIGYCSGCLRCNLIKRCSVSNDAWPDLSEKILNTDVFVIASPVYFHHLSAAVKKIIDRFRSFVKVSITEESILHEPWHQWNKDFVLLLSMGSSSDEDAKPIIELFEYMVKMLGEKNRLHIIKGTRLAVNMQIAMNGEELSKLYKKLNLSEELAKIDSVKNKELLDQCFKLGQSLTSTK